MIPDHANPTLMWVACGHLVVGLACLLALATDAEPVLGVHPALKPMKFGFSIAIFLATMAVVVPALSVQPAVRDGIALVLSLTMVAEIMPIVVQAFRGTTSHFNIQGPFNAALWQIMVAAIAIATLTMLCVAVIATVRPLNGPNGLPMNSLAGFAWRAGLWLFLLAALSGFIMGGRLQHSVGGDDGGPGLPLVNWSVAHGDLRVSHFVALHALQAIPLIGGVLRWAPIADAARWALLFLAVVVCALIAVWTLLRALASRPVW